AGSRRTAARVTRGAISFSSSIHFAPVPYSIWVNPVALPPGRARLATKPAATGSGVCVKTTGTVRVTCNSGPTTEPPEARMIWRECDQLRSVFANVARIACGPADIDPHAATDSPTEFLQPM